MSGQKLKHHRRDNSTITSSWFLRPSGWNSAQLCKIFTGIPPKPSKPLNLFYGWFQEFTPCWAPLYEMILFHALIFLFVIIISPDRWLWILPNRLTCLLFRLFTYVVVYRGEKSIQPWPIDTANTQWNNNNLNDVTVKHLNSTCAWNQQGKYTKIYIFLKYKTNIETPA